MYRRCGKRALDVLGATLLLLLAAPLLALAALAVLLALGRPVLFRQERAGRGGQAFDVLKLRSMRDGPGDDAARLTRFGRALRASALDELPQLWNVLRGEMSLVGPRPVVAAELAEYYGSAAEQYMSVRPGITGLWQVSGRSNTSYAQRVALDVAYASQPSLWTDIKILARTPMAVLARRGAC